MITERFSVQGIAVLTLLAKLHGALNTCMAYLIVHPTGT